MKFSAGQIAQLLGGKVEGNDSVEVNKLAKIEEGVPGSLTFLSNPVYTPYIYKTKASIVIVKSDFTAEKKLPEATTLIRVSDPYSAFGRLLEIYDTFKHYRKGVEQNAVVSSTARLGKDVYIGSSSYIGENVVIGDNCKLYPNVYIGDNTVIGENTIVYAGVNIYNDCSIGKNCVFHSGVIIGGDGFGFSPSSQNDYKKIPQIGNVVIEDHVEIGSNSTVDRATMGSTFIRKGVKIDNLVQIAHNVDVGENTVIAAQTGIAGSAKIGKNCMIGGQVGIVGHITIGNHVKIAAQSGITSSISDNEVVQGSPAFKFADYQRAYVNFRNSTKLNARIDQLEKELKKIFTEKNG